VRAHASGRSRATSARLRGAALLLALSQLVSPALARAEEVATAREPALKAAFVFNFVKFTTWSDVPGANASAPIIIAVMGDEGVGESLVSLTRNRTVNGHPIEVRIIGSAPAPTDVSVLYVAASQDRSLKQISQAFGTPGLLTVGESDLFASSGGIIRLVRENDRIHFDIDAASAQKAGLALSSQLLMLARHVRGTQARAQ
jgi:hypothetical protein